MSTRLVWNFEINENNSLDFDKFSSSEAESLQWEARYFWKRNDIISLHGLGSNFLDLNNYKVKSRQDCYYLLDDSFLNIKVRREELLYKPLLESTPNSLGFGKKINLLDSSLTVLPGSLALERCDLLAQIKKRSKKINVGKVALLYKFNTSPSIKLELARLTIGNNCHFSACIEGRSQAAVEKLSKQIFANYTLCDYVHFLKKYYD